MEWKRNKDFSPQCDVLLIRGDLTNTFSSSGARLKAVIALAPVASLSVDTSSVLADTRFGTTLVQVCQYTEQQIRE